MKPKEFDELVRQKFDQNDFEYSPRNWDRLAEELNGRAKKRNVMMWWWMPLAGVAASVALAMGIPGLLRHSDSATSLAKTEVTQSRSYAMQEPVQDAPVAVNAIAYNNSAKRTAHTRQVKEKRVAATPQNTTRTGIQLHDDVNNSKSMAMNRGVNLLSIGNIPGKNKETKKKEKEIILADGYTTFKEEVAGEVKKLPKLSVILSGGISRGNQNNGYMAGATIRRMINDKVYVEGDIAFSSGSNTQMQPVTVQDPAYTGSGGYSKTAAKIASPEASRIEVGASPATVVKETNVSYNVSYAQVTPIIGYKIMKRMSLAAGPDFQEMLVDNRPTASADYRGTVQQAPTFDIGFVGKTEYAITRNVKAAVSYRKGVNSLITLTDKYIDRDYLQFQVKCAIFNK